MALYLDNNATTALDESVLEAMLPFMGAMPGNPSSVHCFGRLQKSAIEQAREEVAQLVGAQADQVIFTSGGTEANNLLLQGYCQQMLKQGNKTTRISLSAIEHLSLIEPAKLLPLAVDSIAVNTNGLVTLDTLKQAMDENTNLVSVMAANNETGAIQNLPVLVDYAKSKNCFFHTDASQLAGKVNIDFCQLGVDAMTLSAHKFYGPIGIGALIVDKKFPLAKMQGGGSQEHNLRAGTENTPAIVGFGKAALLAKQQLKVRAINSQQLCNALETGLAGIKEITIFAKKTKRLPNTVQFGVEGFDGETLLMQLDKKTIAVSSGSACTSEKVQISHVLQAMQIKPSLANSAIRISFGKNNTLLEVHTFLTELKKIILTSKTSAVMASNV